MYPQGIVSPLRRGRSLEVVPEGEVCEADLAIISAVNVAIVQSIDILRRM